MNALRVTWGKFDFKVWCPHGWFSWPFYNQCDDVKRFVGIVLFGLCFRLRVFDAKKIKGRA